ncbi:DUF1800 domain-containing protein [Neolewinella antarctica]|uniref:Uncharacterized protein (DUF1800 family) n=1 Tax=Neolewinella antarctica TaxID=442734 RepID=A0ABX0XCG7_9BACT|nr:DUF1800 domain-containing protein [Neolewinella antarctica]NJC26892.1 uncharacterized protein (DUF1800 family) [Neolewinella antarctica]
MSKSTTLSRRAFLRPNLAPATRQLAPHLVGAAAPSQSLSNGLTPYAGPWTSQEAGHLLSRATFGATFATQREATSLGLDGTIDRLLEDLPLPPPPVSSHPNIFAPDGQTWVDRPYQADDNGRSIRARRNSLRGWLNQLRVEEGLSTRETMVLFWHNHFSTSFYNDIRWNYVHMNSLRENATGNFRELVKVMTVDAVMLVFLNGNRSTEEFPNENYARELLELFTIGKGPQVGPGDYTNYTEDDIRAIARSLTGWRTRAVRSSSNDSITPLFIPARHDSGTVQLSERFGNQQLASSGRNTYKALVKLIFEQDEVSRYITRKLYRWFVYHEITDEVEANVIEPLAAILRAADYEMKPVLRALFASEHFFDVASQGPMIKNPIRSVVGTLRQLEVQPVAGGKAEDFYFATWKRTEQLGMSDFNPPTVAGWKAYYQEPLFYRQWISATTLPLRQKIVDNLFSSTSKLEDFGPVTYSLLDQVRQFPQPAELLPMIGEWVSLLFPRPLPETQITFLKNILLPGLPDTQWAVEYSEHRANPNDTNLSAALEVNLRRMVKAMLEMPEFQLS